MNGPLPILAQADVASTTSAPANPLAFVESAAAALPGDVADTSAPITIVLLLTLLTIAPSILILCTSFTRFVVVLGLLRQAIGTQGMPPSQVIVGLSLFLTFVAMGPTLQAMWDGGLEPYLETPVGQRDSMAAWEGMKRPLERFMMDQIVH
ncbi:MAG: flagellar type III secretion system pore protein FliP, partial [Planctomycetota bacterium]|nr:flagellar type III secretion system pore protein FliP [Planctomycetota bacterium]